MYEVAVIGAGIIGLSSAVLIQESRSDCHVTVMADQFSPNTTSDGAAGVWTPFLMADTDLTLITETGKETYQHLRKLGTSPLAGQVGSQLLTAFFLEEESNQGDPDLKDYVDGYRRLTQKELQTFPNVRSGYSFDTIVLDVPSYLKWLLARFQNNGGIVRRQHIDGIAQLSGQFDLVVNCCGLGNVKLLNDKRLDPIRGHVIRVNAPWIKHSYLYKPQEGDYSYIIPGLKTVTVGGTGAKGDWNQQVLPEDDTDVWERALRQFPLLAHAKKVTSWAGLRPGRDSLRLEPETMNFGTRKLPVIHNYGHGGSGITLHWGCAQKVVTMLSDLLPPQHTGSNKLKRTSKL